ncbi:hypothetical protein [Vibrio phage J14]|nr:hypothetical protein [Vibrio phage J14]
MLTDSADTIKGFPKRQARQTPRELSSRGLKNDGGKQRILNQI